MDSDPLLLPEHEISVVESDLEHSTLLQNNETVSVGGHEHGNHDKCALSSLVDLSVTETERRFANPLNPRDQYMVYRIETRSSGPGPDGRLQAQASLWRRFSEFESMRDCLVEKHPYVVAPPLPDKRQGDLWRKLSADPFDPEFVDRRRIALERFLLRVAAHPLLSWDPIFIKFIQDACEWKDIVSSTGYLKKIEHHFKSINATMRVKKGDGRFEELLSYSKELETQLSSLLRCRGRLLDVQQLCHRQHSNYGRALSEWSALEAGSLGDALQRAGHYMDAHAAAVDAHVEEEQTYIEQLKEYMRYASALQDVYHHYTMREYQLERLEETLTTLSQQRIDTIQGKQSFMYRILGNVDTDEVREMRVTEVDEQIMETERQINNHSVKLSEFIEKALSDVQQFNERKEADMQKTIAGFVRLQIRTCRKGLLNWQNIRACVDSMEGVDSAAADIH